MVAFSPYLYIISFTWRSFGGQEEGAGIIIGVILNKGI
jgi:hypothetical protein